MKKILFAFCFLFLTLVSNAQSPGFQWAKNMGGSFHDAGNSIAVDASGNIYTTGYFEGTADFDPGPATVNLTVLGGEDMFISKVDSLGNFLWVKRIGGTSNEAGSSIVLDASGNIYTTGYFIGTTDFNPGAGVSNLTSAGFSDAFALKLDASGNFVWAKSMGGTVSDEGKALRLDSSGNVCITGDFETTVDFDPGAGVFNLTSAGVGDIFVVKLDVSGNFVWAGRMGGTLNEVGASITLDAADNIYTTGFFNGTVDFDPSVGGTYNLTSVGQDDIFISKLDASGNFVWAKQFGGLNNDDALSITSDALGNIYTTGVFNLTADFDPGVAVFSLTSAGNNDIFVSKLDSSGNFIWAKRMGSASQDGGSAVTIDGSGNVYTTGYFFGVADFDPGPGISNLISVGSAGAFISKLDASGNFLWAENLGGTLYDQGNSIVVDAINNIYTTGSFQGTADFNPGAATFNLSTGTYNEIFIQKMGKARVWPGDTDNNNIVDNNDLLPIGLFYGQIGTPRSIFSNTWQEYYASDWGILQTNGSDIKHVNCNGDGIINVNDTLAINLNFNSTHAFAPVSDGERMTAPDLHFITSSSTYLSGNTVDVEVWLGTSTTPVTNLYGVAFDINYESSLVQSGTSSVTYPPSWLGIPGSNAITISKIYPFMNIAYGGETRIDHINSSGFGKIADFKFQLKTAIASNTYMHFFIAGYRSNDSIGIGTVFNLQPDSILINPSGVGINEVNNNAQIFVYPNPSNGSFNLFISSAIKNGIVEVYNSIGELVLNEKIMSQQSVIELADHMNGLYFVKVMGDGKIVGVEKVVKQ